MKNKKNPSRPARAAGRSPSANSKAEPAALSGTPWPDDFPSRGRVALLAATLGGILFAAMLFWLLKTYFPSNAWLASVDVRSLAVFTGLLLVAVSGLAHPACGLALLALLRHWLDGVTYPGDNAYFTWGILFLFVLWGVRLLLRGGRIRHRAPILLFGVLLIAGVVATSTGYEFDTSYRNLLNWASAFALFVLVTNALRSRSSFVIVLIAFTAAEICHAIYAIIQYEYVFDYTRQQIMANPSILYEFFGMTQPTPEVMRRLNLNRAFGTMLFPNALAAFLILGIPLSACGAIFSVLRHNETANSATTATARECNRFALLVLLAALSICGFATGLFSILAFMDAGLLLLFCVTFGLSLAVAVIHAAVARHYAAVRGRRPAQYGMAAYFFLLLFAIQCTALWRTYSRGALLALACAGAAGAALMWWSRGQKMRPASATALAVGLFVAFALSAGAALDNRAVAQEGRAPAIITPTAKANTAEITAVGAHEGLPLETRKLLEEGADISMREMLDPASFGLRVSYWKVALRMMADNWVLGVGPGNFGVAYPKYQTVDAGDVQTAHNDFLQAWCEFGLLGALAFTGFWAYFLLWGAARIKREPHAASRWLLVGLYTGALAFLIHCQVDFNFQNPSVAFYAFLVCGLFYSLAHLAGRETATRTSQTHQVLLLVLVVAAALVFGMSLRLYRQDYALSGMRLNVASLERLNRQADVGHMVYREMFQYGMARYRSLSSGVQQRAQVPCLPLTDTLVFLQSDPNALSKLEEIRPKLEEMGVLSVKTSDGGWRRLNSDEPLNARVWFWLNKLPWYAMDFFRPAAEAWLAQVEAIDTLFPYRPDVAAYLTDWYEMLIKATPRARYPEKHSFYLAKCLDWARIAVDRSPQRSEFRSRLALAHWIQADASEGDARHAACERAIEQYRLAQRFRPESSGRYNRDLALGLQMYGELLADEGRAEEGRQYLEESKAFQEKAEYIEKERVRLGLP